jgi:hypothetical protein
MESPEHWKICLDDEDRTWLNNILQSIGGDRYEMLALELAFKRGYWKCLKQYDIDRDRKTSS